MADDTQYQALYRKYRPQGPEELLGQDHVIRTLMGAVKDGRLAHAFLFCGPRGTGKTSTARILAKMVNCERGPTPDPCGTCEQCAAIRDGSHLDVVEIDAASHGGVDDARDLREKAPTAPVQGREKVYIIDEAQRLSREAFDALLKVFEEPPHGVRFVLATTEPHKMPATIIGRCQRFDFRRGSIDVVSEHLQRVAKEEGMTLAPDTAVAIARQSEGSFRDAISLLDQASVLAGVSEIGEEVLASLLGEPHGDVQHAIVDAVAIGDAKTVFAIVNLLVQEGQDLRHVTSELLTHLRNLLLVKTAPGQEDLIDVTGDEYERLRAQGTKLSPAEISRVIALLLAAQMDMRWTTSPRLTLELALVRATIPDADPQPAGLMSRIERLERVVGVAGGSAAAASGTAGAVGEAAASPTDPSETRQSPPARRPAADDASPPATPTAESPTTPPKSKKKAKPVAADASPTPSPTPHAPAGVDVDSLRRSWGTLVEHLRTSREMILAANLEAVTVASFDGSTLELAFPPDRIFGVSKVEAKAAELQRALQELFAISPAIECAVRDPVAGPPDPADDDELPLSEEEVLARVQAELDAEITKTPAPGHEAG